MVVDHDELVFVPQVGFRLAHGALQSANVVVTKGGQTLAAGLTSERDGTDIALTITGVEEQLDFRQSRPVEAPVTVIDDRGKVLEERASRYVVESAFYRLMEGPTQFQRMVALERLDPDVRAVDFTMTGGVGEWRLRIPVEPLSNVDSRALTTTGASAALHGIEIAITHVASTPTLTAVELEVRDLRRRPDLAIQDLERWIEGVSSFQHLRGLGQDLLTLRDSTGAHHLERAHGILDRAPRGMRREVALFEPLPEGAIEAVLEIPYVAVRERSEELRVPVPGETEISLNGCRARVTASRVARSSGSNPERPSPVGGLNGPCVRLVVAPLDEGAERQMVMVGVLESNDRGMSVSRVRAEPVSIEVPDPTGESTFVTLKGPVIRLAGPWTLDFPLRP